MSNRSYVWRNDFATARTLSKSPKSTCMRCTLHETSQENAVRQPVHTNEQQTMGLQQSTVSCRQGRNQQMFSGDGKMIVTCTIFEGHKIINMLLKISNGQLPGCPPGCGPGSECLLFKEVWSIKRARVSKKNFCGSLSHWLRKTLFDQICFLKSMRPLAFDSCVD